MEKLESGKLEFDASVVRFCDDFASGSYPRVVFGRNEYAESIISTCKVDAVVDEFTDLKEYMGVPVIRLNNVSDDALLVSVVIGKPLLVGAKLKQAGYRFLDYFAFAKISDLPLKPVKFWPLFIKDFAENREKYDQLFDSLADPGSRHVLESIINFRLSSNLRYMRYFEEAQHRQYFEDFLQLRKSGESFADVGSYDGYTSKCFIDHCPDYSDIHVFEPDFANMKSVKKNLQGYKRIHYHSFGLSDSARQLHFISSGSTSRVSEQGDITIDLQAYDEAVKKPVSFIKMDIEGGEAKALAGMQKSIAAYHPRLAISAYHRFDDLWRLPEQVLAYRQDYDLYLRHYTEGVDETVMFFIPRP